MSQAKEIKKLSLLLPHWIEHNQEHAQDFRTWAERAGKAKEDLEKAANHLDRATLALERALSKLSNNTP